MRIQKGCIFWFDMQYPKLIMLLFHIPNGGKRNIIEAVNFKKMGVRAGVADLFLSVSSLGFHGLYIEIKMPGGTQGDNQKKFQQQVEANGYKYCIADSVDFFITIIQWYLIGTAYHHSVWRQSKFLPNSGENSP